MWKINALRILFTFPVDRTNSLYMSPWSSGYVLCFHYEGRGFESLPLRLLSVFSMTARQDYFCSVYGPVASWRFGSSLGIDPIGLVSTCSFNCAYCQLGEDQATKWLLV